MMKTFTDNAGRGWTVALTIDSVKRVRDLLGVNLLELNKGDPPLLTQLGQDVILLCDVIYCLVKPQADAAGVSDEQFGAALGGEAILEAQKAFFQELVGFFRQVGRGDMAQAAEKQQRMIQLAIQRAEQRIATLDVEGEIESAFSMADESNQSRPPVVSERSESNRGSSSTSSPE
jgi:hypothetical protein